MGVDLHQGGRKSFTSIATHSISNAQYHLLPIFTYLSALGSSGIIDTTVSFLAEWLGLSGLLSGNLYDSIVPIIQYGQVLVSVMGIAFLTLIVGFSYVRQTHIDWKKIFLTFAVTAIVIAACYFLIKPYVSHAGLDVYHRYMRFNLSSATTDGVSAKIIKKLDERNLTPVNKPYDAIDRIQERGVLRVGYHPGLALFCFFNKYGKLVGYDVAFAYNIASVLHVNIEFIPFTWINLVKDIQANKFDMAISGIYVSINRLDKVSFTDPYFRSPISLIVRRDDKNKFSSGDDLRAMTDLRLGAFRSPPILQMIHRHLPNATVVIFSNFNKQIFPALKQNKIDAALWSEAQLNILAMQHPGYVAITPTAISLPFLMAYMTNSNSPRFLSFLNYMLKAQEYDGFQEQIYNHWIKYYPLIKKTYRWSILNDVLGWDKHYYKKQE